MVFAEPPAAQMSSDAQPHTVNDLGNDEFNPNTVDSGKNDASIGQGESELSPCSCSLLIPLVQSATKNVTGSATATLSLARDRPARRQTTPKLRTSEFPIICVRRVC